MTTVLGPGMFDRRFDWAAHAAEVSSILIADAKAGRNATEGQTEARAPTAARPRCFRRTRLAPATRGSHSLRCGVASPARRS